jgi:glycosyltransferase involved in cell wall biosynthesis
MALAPPLLERRTSPVAGAPLVSVGMPVFNGEKFIASAIESVLGQTFADLELIISDNASSDATVAICERYVALDRRVRLLRSSANVGAHPNYRKVAHAARGQYFKWASANDLLAPDYLERCLDTLEKRPDAVLAFGTTVLFEEDPGLGTPYDDRMHLEDEDAFHRFRRCTEQLRLNNVINSVVRTSALRRTSVMPNYMGADNLVLAELALAGKFIEVPTTRFYRRMSPEGAMKLQGNEAVLLHHHPTGGARGLFQAWRIARGYLRAVLRGELSAGQRLRAVAYVARQTYWRAPDLVQDILEAFRFWVLRDRGAVNRRGVND